MSPHSHTNHPPPKESQKTLDLENGHPGGWEVRVRTRLQLLLNLENKHWSLLQEFWPLLSCCVRQEPLEKDLGLWVSQRNSHPDCLEEVLQNKVFSFSNFLNRKQGWNGGWGSQSKKSMPALDLGNQTDVGFLKFIRCSHSLQLPAPWSQWLCPCSSWRS